MRRLAVGLGLIVAAAGPLAAQQPTLSRSLQVLLQKDTVAAIWLFARPDRSLDEVTALVRAAGGEVRQQSRWLHAVSANLSTAALRQLSTRPEVQHMQRVARFRRPTPVPSALSAPSALFAPNAAAQSPDDSLYGASAMPFHRLNIFPLVDRGFRGTGIRVAMLDTGFENLRSDFAAAHVIAQRDFVFKDSVVRNQFNDVANASQHGTSTWGLLAANDPGQIIGIAPDALYILAKTEDIRSETRVEEDNYVAALEWADSLGAQVVSSSLGYRTFDDGTGYTFDQLNGDVAVTTVAADIAAQRGILVVTAMGNDGPASRSIETPADGDSVLAAGAEDSTGVIAGFSSRGPTADSRIKPDLTAPGVAIFVVDALSGSGFNRGSGTSFSTPILAGAATLLRQIHPTLGPIEIIDALKHTGTHAASPDTIYGWGRPDVFRAATFPAGIALPLALDTALTTVTPTVTWSVPNAPAFALPYTYRVRVATTTAFDSILIDTTTTATSLALLRPLAPGATIAVEVTATSADSTADTVHTPQALAAPAWATLKTLDDPVGSTIRDVRPTFVWESPVILEPPGPFTYNLSVIRADDGTLDLEQTDISANRFVPSRDLERNTPYRWRLVAHIGADSAVTDSRGTFVITDDNAPAVTLLFQNFPNPFPDAFTGEQATCVWFDLATPGRVRLDILDLMGHVVRTLVPGGPYGPILRSGRYGRPLSTEPGRCDQALEWDGTATDGSTVPRGIYLAKLDTPDGVFFKRIVFLGR